MLELNVPFLPFNFHFLDGDQEGRHLSSNMEEADGPPFFVENP